MTIDHLTRAFASTRAVLATVRPEDLDRPTPCASWDVRALINHFIGSARWAGATIGGEAAPEDEDHAAGDLLAAYDHSSKLTLAAFGADGALERTVHLPFGELTGAALMALAANDQFTHGWDLARAVGHHTDLDPGLAEDLLAQARVTVPDAYRGPEGVGLFAPAAEPAPGASPADRLAAFLGRA
ncbi:TIGR03086 family metal-binding protein [Dactylosporangium sp. McL0621]|uniref:TIGR03086 family metal-binding protein n=1 Tax=Dactylosporangium sp. McL0621 TaxID=3415678 RepID=UPI003CEF605F